MRVCAFSLWMLSWVALAVARREVWWCSAGGLVGLAVRVAVARGTWTPSGKFGLANTVTLVRLALVVSLPVLFQVLPPLAFAALVPLLLVLDGLDGELARSRGEASTFGAALDMETDALAVMVLGLLLWAHEEIGPWVLVAGLWRYVYALTVALVPSLGEAPPTRFGRSIFVVLMSCLAGAFLPVPRLPSLLAAVSTAVVSISFVYSLARSQAFTSPESAARKGARVAR
jgi:phosphatidylglycerophosphate synthase